MSLAAPEQSTFTSRQSYHENPRLQGEIVTSPREPGVPYHLDVINRIVRAFEGITPLRFAQLIETADSSIQLHTQIGDKTCGLLEELRVSRVTDREEPLSAAAMIQGKYEVITTLLRASAIDFNALSPDQAATTLAQEAVMLDLINRAISATQSDSDWEEVQSAARDILTEMSRYDSDPSVLTALEIAPPKKTLAKQYLFS